MNVSGNLFNITDLSIEDKKTISPSTYLYDVDVLRQQLSDGPIKLRENEYSANQLLECAQQIKSGGLDGIHTPEKEACFLVTMNILLFSTWSGFSSVPYEKIVNRLFTLFGEQTFIHGFKVASIIHSVKFSHRDVMSNMIVPYSNFKIYDNDYISIATEILDIDYDVQLRGKLVTRNVKNIIYKDLHHGSNNIPPGHWVVAKGMDGNVTPIWGEAKFLEAIRDNYPNAYKNIIEFVLPMLDQSPVPNQLISGFHPPGRGAMSAFEPGSFELVQELHMYHDKFNDYEYEPDQWQKLANAFKVLTLEINHELIDQIQNIRKIFTAIHAPSEVSALNRVNDTP